MEALEQAKRELVQQYESKQAELERLRKAIDAIDTTISIVFNGSSPIAEPAVESPSPTTVTEVISEPDDSIVEPLPEPEPAAPAPKPASSKTTKSRSPKAKAAAGELEWQRHMGAKYSGLSLPKAISLALQQAKDPMNATDVYGKIFKSTLPKRYQKEMRSRIATILSAGCREGKWTKVEPGIYTI